jgi:hypothetical protein
MQHLPQYPFQAATSDYQNIILTENTTNKINSGNVKKQEILKGKIGSL